VGYVNECADSLGKYREWVTEFSNTKPFPFGTEDFFDSLWNNSAMPPKERLKISVFMVSSRSLKAARTRDSCDDRPFLELSRNATQRRKIKDASCISSKD